MIVKFDNLAFQQGTSVVLNAKRIIDACQCFPQWPLGNNTTFLQHHNMIRQPGNFFG